MNAFDKIIASKLSQSNSTSADPMMWKKIESELEAPRSESAQFGQAGFFAGVLSTIFLGVLMTQLPNAGSIHAISQEQEIPASPRNTEKQVSSETLELFRAFEPQERHEIRFVDQSSQADIVTNAIPSTNKVSAPLHDSESHTKSDSKPSVKSNELTTAPISQGNNSKGDNAEIYNPSLQFKAIGIQCIGETVVFEAQGSYDKVEWLFDGINFASGSSAEYRFNEAGTHQVMLIAYTAGERYSVVREIEVYALPQPRITSKVSSHDRCFKAEVHLAAEPGTNAYSWTYNSLQVNDQTGNYVLENGTHVISLSAVNEHGCVNETTTTVQVSEARELFIPKAFSPDSDGNNDVWFPEGMDLAERFTVKVFDLNSRNMVYQSNEQAPWDGYLSGSGRKAERGEKYIYEVIATDACGYTIKRDGVITIF